MNLTEQQTHHAALCPYCGGPRKRGGKGGACSTCAEEQKRAGRLIRALERKPQTDLSPLGAMCPPNVLTAFAREWCSLPESARPVRTKCSNGPSVERGAVSVEIAGAVARGDKLEEVARDD